LSLDIGEEQVVMEASPKVEKEVIGSCKAGDEKAFVKIVLAYQKRVYNIAYRILGNKEEAKDLAQEVFLSVFESIKNLREEVKFEPWLIQITVNHCRNKWKYLKTRKYFQSDSLDGPIETEGEKIPRQVYDPSENPETLLEKRMIQNLVQKGMLQLKEEQRELIVLRDLQGLSYGEIGELFSIPEGTVKSKIHRARMELKEILDRMGR
jgi:RNA polymerase sigma-70 factor (ECF subfamily)